MEIISAEQNSDESLSTSVILRSQIGLPNDFSEILLASEEISVAFQKTQLSRQEAIVAIKNAKKAAEYAEELSLTSHGELQIFAELCLRCWRKEQSVLGFVMDNLTKENFIK